MQQAISILFFVVFCSIVYGQNQTNPGASLPYYSGVPSGRIVNGQTVDIQNFPFIVGVRVNNAQICGGSIISAKHVVSAAHCLKNRPVSTAVTVRAGSTSQTSSFYVFQVSYYVLHPYYNPQTTDYDAAVITISTSFAGNPNIRAVPLQETELGPTWCYALGWGSNGIWKPDLLQYVVLQLQSQSTCANAWSTKFTQQMVCAKNTNVDMCSGDSGGPLVCNNRLTGIVSYGGNTCQGILPAAFAKVASPSIRSFIRAYAGI